MSSNGMSRRKLSKSLLKKAPEMEALASRIDKAMPYRFPTGYMEWNELRALVAMQMVSVAHRGVVKQLGSMGDQAGYFNAHRYSLWAVQQAPIYCLSKEVFHAMLNTTINEEIIKNLEISLPTIMLLFPDSSLRSSEAVVDHLVIHTSDLRYPENSTGKNFGYEIKYLPQEKQTIIHSTTVDQNSITWLAGMSVEEGKVDYDKSNKLGVFTVEKDDDDFLDIIRQIALMTYIILQSNPEMIGEVAESEIPKTVGKGFTPQQKGKYIKPRIIRVPNNKKAKVESPTTRQGSHSSKRTHWRKAHYRNIQSKDGQPKLVYVRAAIINPQ